MAKTTPTAINTAISRFPIHDVLTAPEESVHLLRGALARGGQLPNFLGVLAGSPTALRAYTRFRSELRHGDLDPLTLDRIALAVAEYYQSPAALALNIRAARAAGLGLDEVTLARQFESDDPREAILLRYLKVLLEQGQPSIQLHEEVREADWSEDQILEAIASLALEIFATLVTVAGDVPTDGSHEESRSILAQ